MEQRKAVCDFGNYFARAFGRYFAWSAAASSVGQRMGARKILRANWAVSDSKPPLKPRKFPFERLDVSKEAVGTRVLLTGYDSILRRKCARFASEIDFCSFAVLMAAQNDASIWVSSALKAVRNTPRSRCRLQVNRRPNHFRGRVLQLKRRLNLVFAAKS